MEKYWRDFDVSYKPWRDFKHVWHWYGTNCTKLQRSTGTKSCRQSLTLPSEFVQPEPSNRDIFQQKNSTKTTLVCSPFSLCLPRTFWCRSESRMSSLLLDFQNHLTLGLFYAKWWGKSPNPAAGHHGLRAWSYRMDIVHTGSTCSIKAINWKKNVLPLEFCVIKRKWWTKLPKATAWMAPPSVGCALCTD